LPGRTPSKRPEGKLKELSPIFGDDVIGQAGDSCGLTVGSLDDNPGLSCSLPGTLPPFGGPEGDDVLVCDDKMINKTHRSATAFGKNCKWAGRGGTSRSSGNTARYSSADNAWNRSRQP
jgi:hypothetical protein